MFDVFDGLVALMDIPPAPDGIVTDNAAPNPASIA
jgi:hypothetical protein